MGYIAHNCTIPDDGKEKRGDGNETSAPNVKDSNIRHPPAHSNPRVMTLSNGSEVKQCDISGKML